MRYSKELELPVSAAAAFTWHERAGAFQQLIPPWERVQVARADPGLIDGNRLEMRVHVGPVPCRWIAEIRDVKPGLEFTDVQIKGPFRRWTHRHQFIPLGPHRSRLVDDVQFELPTGRLAHLLVGRLINRRLDRLFAFRHEVTVADLADR